MSLNEQLNIILKEMWRLEEKNIAGSQLDTTEKDFYNTHISDIKDYYSKNNSYWQSKNHL